MGPDSYRDLIQVVLIIIGIGEATRPASYKWGGFLFIYTMEYIVYILFSEKLNRFYTGSTSNIDIRLHLHKNAPVNKYTHGANDWILLFSIYCDNKSQMLSIEKHIKKHEE